MSTFTFLVTVDTERTAGLHASRDDQAEIIAGELESAIENVSISGLGARSDSEYDVVESSVAELDSKELRALNAEHEERVREELPGDAELRKELKAKVDEVRDLQATIKSLEGKIARSEEAKDVKDTTMWWEARHGERNYIPDDAMIYLMLGNVDNETYRVRQTDQGPEVMYNGWRGLRIRPNSGNVFYLEAGER